ncbi:MAG TPA: Arc family DNA-binding protein [Candidatus Paceibacterota bacterium]|nr:Arc family DNA-binding protein [Verrucomicrobiota bacterium]HRY48925.1 Arc family DNA-binding protein [Candidatus Paceibacterota bacterium]HRZ99137.1 Arc family DNA-binding protein [Candidatus Paceibacterota bacterium]
MEQRKSFLLRVSPALWVELETWAQEDLRSVNAQIEYLLREAVLRRRRTQAGSRPTPLSGSEEKP